MWRWILSATLVVCAVYFLTQKSAQNPRAVQTERPLPVLVSKAQIPFKPEVSPQRAPAQVGSEKAHLKATIKLDRAQVDGNVERPLLEQKSHRWRWLSGAVAVSSSDPRVAGIARLSERAGFWIIAEGDLPGGVEGLPLVEREDNGLVGIFTGVMKAMGKSGLQEASQFQTQCPCEVQESYPQLKSYLLKPHGDNYSEFKDCLQGLGVFKKLEWEILDHPRTHR